MTTFAEIASFVGDDDAEVTNLALVGVSSLNNPRPNTVTFSTTWDERVGRIVQRAEDTLFILPVDAPTLPNVVRHPRPRLCYALVVKEFFGRPEVENISSTAIVHPSVRLGQGVDIGDFCVLEDGVEIGDNTRIGHHTVISRRVTLGANVRVGTHCSIGGPGFGYENDENGRPIHIEHLGAVSIGDHVEIGSQVTIARGTIEDTRIGDHVKIDDKVFIAHNVSIDENTFIIAGAELSGSVRVGSNVWIAPEASVINKVSIGDGSLVGIGSVVVKDVLPYTVVAGVPAKTMGSRRDPS